MNCSKTPALIELNSFDGDYLEYEACVYQEFVSTFQSGRFFINGKPVIEKRHPEIKGMSATFWHIVATGDTEETKEPDMRRYERIRWPAFILSYCIKECKKLLIWKNTRKSKTRLLLWCKDIDYLVVLSEHKDYYVFWTAYPITRKHTALKLQKEYDAYAKSAC